MRFMVMHKVDANMEAGGPPSQRIISSMGALVQQSLQRGVFITGAGLHPSPRRVRLKCVAGECQLTKGPYAGENELLACFAMISAASLDEAVAHAQRLAAALGGEVEIEVGPIVEPWDLGLMPKPAAGPARFLLLCKADAPFEAGGVPSESWRAALAELERGLEGNGALLAADSLAPSAKGARLASGPAGKRSWVDGPFAESKELIAGFSILEVPSRDDALAWAERYAAILLDNEVDVRELDAA
jgi:hypothetical protein